MDEFADLLAEDLTIAEITRRMGISRDVANGMLRSIRTKLGPQAV
ncbi:hypothetical protein [uncultured Novosphingobium sp.]